MATPQYAYDLDPYGDNPKNRITGERHTITPANGKTFNYFIPNFAPFHRRGFEMRSVVNGQVAGLLAPTVDYYFGFRYDQMLLAGGMAPIYGAIVLNDPEMAGEVEIAYNTLGDEYVISTTMIATILANNVIDPRRVQWGAVVDVPDEVPAIAHKHNAMETMIGMDHVVDAIYVMVDQMASGFNKAWQALQEHMSDHHNPHYVTAEQVGVDGNGTLVPATEPEAVGQTDNNKYMTSLRVAQQINAKVIPVIDAHKQDITNPHKVTKAQVGLSDVSNFPTANNTEGEGGVATNRFMTPATVKAAMTYWVPLLMDFHTDDFGNPHKVTKAQVGLGSVANYPVASTAQAINGTANDVYMTPYLVAQAISSGASQGLSAHMTDFNNPHRVTKAQLGLSLVGNYALASVDEAVAGTANDVLMTPYLVTRMIATGANASLQGHLADHENPHQVTKAQVGLGQVENLPLATTDQAIAGTNNAAYMTPYLVAQMIAVGESQALSTHLVDYDNPHKVTKAQVGLDKVQNYGIAAQADITSLQATDLYVVPAHLQQFLTDKVIPLVNDSSGAGSAEDIGLGNVQNLEIASVLDIRKGEKKYVTADVLGGHLETMAAVLPIYASRYDLFTSIQDRFPYEYTLIRPQRFGGPYFGDADGYGPRWVSPNGSWVWENLNNYGDASTLPISYDGTLSFTNIMDGGIIIGAATLHNDNDDVYMAPDYAIITVRIVGTRLEVFVYNTATESYVSQPAIPSKTITRITSGAAWSLKRRVDDIGSTVGFEVTCSGQTLVVDYANLTLPAGAQDVDPSLGFFSRISDFGVRWKVINWLPLDLILCIYQSERNQWRYTNATGWVQAKTREVWDRVIPGMFSFNRFTGEVFGAVTKSEIVPLQGKQLISSDEIKVTETPLGYQLSLVGPIKSTLDLGTNDITLDMN